MLLSRAGYIVEHVDDGEKAWTRISADVGWFDVLVTDTKMPRMDGLALVRRVRAAGFTGRIIVHSPGFVVEEKEPYQRCGVQAVVQKMSSIEVMLAAIDPHDRRPTAP